MVRERKVTVSAALKPDVVEAVDALARKRNTSRSEVISIIVEMNVERLADEMEAERE